MEREKKKILIIGEFSVIHKGYINFFNKILKQFRGTKFYLGFLDAKTVSQLTKLESDIRKIPFSAVKKIIGRFLSIDNFFLFDKNNFSKLIKKINPRLIIVLKGEKGEDFAKRYLANKYKKIIKYYDIRLTWPLKRVAEFKKAISNLPKIKLSIHQNFMKEAFKEAEKPKCWWRQVGAILVKNGKIILRAFNEMMPTDDECYKIGCIRDQIPPGKLPEICSVAHAEATIISTAANQGISLKNTTLYVTHFPCSACAKLVALSGIKTLVYSRGSSVFDGGRVLTSRGVEIIKI